MTQKYKRLGAIHWVDDQRGGVADRRETKRLVYGDWVDETEPSRRFLGRLGGPIGRRQGPQDRRKAEGCYQK